MQVLQGIVLSVNQNFNQQKLLLQPDEKEAHFGTCNH